MPILEEAQPRLKRGLRGARTAAVIAAVLLISLLVAAFAVPTWRIEAGPVRCFSLTRPHLDDFWPGQQGLFETVPLSRNPPYRSWTFRSGNRIWGLDLPRLR
jgi:hypothetical protein